jgi:hypothetical protein
VPVFSRRGPSSAHANIHNREWGGRWLTGITCEMVRPTARCMYWHRSTMARFLKRWPFDHPSTSGLDQVKEESAERCGRWPPPTAKDWSRSGETLRDPKTERHWGQQESAPLSKSGVQLAYPLSRYLSAPGASLSAVPMRPPVQDSAVTTLRPAWHNAAPTIRQSACDLARANCVERPSSTSLPS